MNDFKIVVCASGGGGNFKALIDAQESVGYTITKLIVNKDCGAIKIAEEHKIPWQCIKSKGNVNFANDIIEAIPTDTELIVLAGYMPILPDLVCQKFNHKIINTHPSLLPKYGGKGMYGVKVQEAVMEAHESKAGCTVHYVTKDVDAGDIILQKEIDVNYSETPWQLGGRIFEEEIKLLPEAIKRVKNNNKPTVSIACLVYNHEPFLRDCFEGFVMQQTTFPIEILVHDDASTDHSADIIREYTAKYPDLFKPIYQTENQYSKGVDVFSINVKRAQGKYIAMCEGDDYWTDPLKLQKQVDFLEEHEEYSVCCHRYKIYDVNYDKYGPDYVVHLFELMPNGFSFSYKDNLQCWITKTMTIVYRKVAMQEWQLKCPKYKYNCDVHLNYHLLKNGQGYCMPNFMAVYRIHKGGVFSSLDNEQKMRAGIMKYKELALNNKNDVFLREFVDKCMYKFYYNVVLKNVERHIFNYADIQLCIDYYRRMNGLIYALGCMKVLTKRALGIGSDRRNNV